MKRSRADKDERLARIREKIENTDTGANAQGWFNPKEGRNTIRIMPEVGEMEPGAFFQEVGLHYLPAGESSKRVYCPEFTTNGDEPCPICEFVEELYRSTDKLQKKMAGELRVRKSYWMNIIDRADEAAGPKIFQAGVTIMRAIIGVINDPDYGDITDEYTGFDVKVERAGSGMETKYQVLMMRNPSPLAGTVKQPDEDLMDEWFNKAKDLSAVVVSSDPDEDKELADGHAVWVLPYDRLAAEYNLDSLFEDDVEEEDDDEYEEEVPQHPVQRAVSERRARRARR